jgi:hypothetical protein
MIDFNSFLAALMVIFGGAAFTAIVRLIHSHSIYLYGHRIPSSDFTTFRLAIQNAESTRLDGTLRAELICGAGAKFVDEDPAIFAGPRGMSATRSEDDKRYSLEFDQVPPYDTWVIVCKLQADVNDPGRDGKPGKRVSLGDQLGMTLRLRELDDEGQARQRNLRRISVDQLVMSPSDTIKVVGRARKPLIPLGIMMIVLASAAYALTAGLWIHLSAEEPKFEWPWDVLAFCGIVAAVSFFLVNAAPPAARSIQGYLDPTPVARNSTPAREADQTTRGA